MKLSLKHKIIGTNLLVLIITFVVVSAIVIEGFNVLNRYMLVENLKHQQEVSIRSIRQILLSDTDQSRIESEFSTRAKDFASKLAKESGFHVLIFSKSKVLLADSEDSSTLKSDLKELDEAKKGNRAYVIQKVEGKRYLYYAFPMIMYEDVVGEILFVYPMGETDKNTQNIQILFLIAFIMGVIIILTVSIILSLRITRPIQNLKQSAMEIANGNFGNKISLKASDEVGDLARAFNIMSCEIENRINIIDFEKGKLNAILESMGEGVIALDGNGDIIAINTIAASYMNVTLEKEIKRIANKVKDQHERTVNEVNLMEKSFLICATPLVYEKDEKGIVLVLNDVTELRLLQEKQRQFVTNVSHELKTPLTTILGYIDLLKTKGENKEIFETSVNYLQSAGERLERLVDDLIDLSCLSKFEFEIEPQSIDLSSLVQDIVGQMSLKAQKFGIKINLNISKTKEIMADPARIKQAVVNILDNAIKYSPQGSITVNLLEQEEVIKLEFADSGCGIPQDVLDKIFEPFFRVDKARARGLGGNGLGLAITKEIIEKHNGEILIQSKIEEGTTVTMILPKK